MTFSSKPQVLKLSGLVPATPYKVVFGASDESVTFTTLGQKQEPKLIFVSCDRFLDDGDRYVPIES